jgi:putative peptidoglycan lipid II flippase
MADGVLAPRPTSTARAAAGMGVIALVSRLIGFVRVLVVAAVLGTTFLGNAFQSANSVSNVLFELLAAGALSAVLVPAFVKLLEAGDRAGAEEVAGGVLGVALVVLGALSVAGIVAAPLLARALTLGVPADVAEEQRELVTFLLRFFVPQVVLYAAGTVATAVLHSLRRFAVAAAAPIGNTVVMVASLVAFRAVAGPSPSLDLSSGERWLLVLAGTGGVVAFVGSLLVTCAAAGFRLRPRWPSRGSRVGEVLRHSGWGVVLHTGAGILLGAAIVAGSSIEGGVVAYQVGWVFFLGPYAVLAQPLHTAILPELVAEAGDADLVRFRRSLRWAMERMSLLVIPVSVAMVVVALPAMRLVAFGESAEGGAPLLAAALASLGVGLFPYSAFLLLSRAYYALDDSRTPGLVSVAVAVAGAVVMAVGAAATDGTAQIAVLGGAHSLAYGLGAVVLALGLRRRLGAPVAGPVLAKVALPSIAVGGVAWLAIGPLTDRGDRAGDLGSVAAAVGAGGLALAGCFALLRVRAGITARPSGPTAVPA